MRRNLVVVRAGDTSLHPTWLPQAGERSWDLVVSYFGNQPGRFAAPDVTCVDWKGPKLGGIHALFRDRPDLLDRYDYVWLPDDDLAIAPAHVDRLFAEMRRFDLLLGQPGLTPDSHWSWTVTLRNPATRLRYVNFIEVMLPCFRADLLRRVLPDFAAYVIGTGFDWVWPLKSGPDPRRVAVLDAVAATHTRPFGGPVYRHMQGLPFDVADEMAHILRTNGVASASTRVLGLRTRLGLELRGDTGLGRAVLRAGYRALVAEAYLRRKPYRWDLDKRLRQAIASPDAPAERLPIRTDDKLARLRAAGLAQTVPAGD